MTTYYVAPTGNDTTGDGSVGNPYASPGKAAGVATTSGDIIYVKSGTYTLTSSSSNVAGGRVTLSPGVRMEGYGTTGGDLGTPPTIHAGAITGISVVTMTGTYTGSTGGCSLTNVDIDGNSGAGTTGVTVSTSYEYALSHVRVSNCPANGFTLAGVTEQGYGAYLKATSCGVGFLAGRCALYGCIAIDCTSHGFRSTVGMCSFARCIAAGGGGDGFRGHYHCSYWECVAHGNTGSGFYPDSFPPNVFINCVATQNGAYGFRNITANGHLLFINNATYLNTSGAINNAPLRAIGTVTLTGDPWTNAASDDYTPNTTAGAGAALRAAGIGIPGQSSYLDIGAVQHADQVRAKVF